VEFVVWLLMQARERLWDTVPQDGTAAQTPRSQATLDLIHVLNEVLSWADRSHYGDSGEILPIASVERQAFYDVLNVAVKTTIDSLRDWDPANEDMMRRDMVTHLIALDTVASKVCQPYYVSQMATIGSLAIFGKGSDLDGTVSGSVVADDDGQRGHDPGND
jgi:hypothetical protein